MGLSLYETWVHDSTDILVSPSGITGHGDVGKHAFLGKRLAGCPIEELLCGILILGLGRHCHTPRDYDKGSIALRPARKLCNTDVRCGDLGLGRIDNLSIEYRGISPHCNLTSLEYRHDIFPGHAGYALRAVVAKQLTIESGSFNGLWALEYSLSTIEISSTVVVDETGELGYSCSALTAGCKTGNAILIHSLCSSLKLHKVSRN